MNIRLKKGRRLQILRFGYSKRKLNLNIPKQGDNLYLLFRWILTIGKIEVRVLLSIEEMMERNKKWKR